MNLSAFVCFAFWCHARISQTSATWHITAAVTMFLTQQLELARRCRRHNGLQQPNVSETTKRIPRHNWRSPHLSISGGKTCSFKSIIIIDMYNGIDNGVWFHLFSTPFLGVSLDLLATSNSVLKIILKKCKIWWALRWVKASLMQNTPVNVDAQCLEINLDKAVKAILSRSWPLFIKKWWFLLW